MNDKKTNAPAPAASEIDAFNLAWAQFENVIRKNYLDYLPDAKAEPLALSVNNGLGDLLKTVQMSHVERIIYDKEENTLAKFNSVYSSLALSGASVFVLLQNTGEKTELYLGTVDSISEMSAQKTLTNAVSGNFPGVIQTPVMHNLDTKTDTDIKSISHSIRNDNCLAIITGVPSLKESTEESFSQGLEKLIDAMGNNKYSALFLASPVDKQRLLEIESHYQRLYSDLSVFNLSSLSLSAQESIAIGKTVGKSVSNSLSNSYSLAETETHGTSTSDANGKTKNWNSGAAAAGAGVGAVIGSFFPGPGTMAGAVIGGAVGGVIGMFFGSSSETHTEGTTDSQGTTKTETDSETVTEMLSETESDTATTSSGKTFQYEVKNRAVQDALKIIEEQLERIRIAKSYGAWNWAAYFTAENKDIVKCGAEIYSGVLRGEKTGVEHCAVSYFVKNGDDDVEYQNILDQVSCFRHPVFDISISPDQDKKKKILIAPTALLSTSEVSVGMALPQKSIPGLPVFESVEFGRSVITYDMQAEGKEIKIGNVSRFGSETRENVNLSINSLTAHTFITGSTGAGKSNAVYSLLRALGENNIPFLVIEPAKGEYRHVFSDAKVFGTNPRLTELLRINPFSFPKEIHVTEHIDRLIEILNAVWPMYAAMPAILKDAVETTYMKCGWNLQTSENVYDPAVFPDFFDLLDVLPGVINESKYGEEVKSNYSGSLLTRVKSLTNGYYRAIFQKDEIESKDLFDENCIVDLSRIGSSETKSMLMGIIFLKLQEYRMAKSEMANANLKHITVIEEAHNLLRRTNTEQGMETANLQGKAVEMISNAVAEMRTYGEGFIIADQSPSLLDKSVIRNTNTKIILRLPDYEDRQLVGKSENLSDAQIDELARMKTGCASVYQNNWQEAVLCQIELFNPQTGAAPDRPVCLPIKPDGRSLAQKLFIDLLLRGLTGANDNYYLFEDGLKEEEKNLIRMYYPRYVSKLKTKSLTETDLLVYADKILVDRYIPKFSPKSMECIEEWTSSFIKDLLSDSLVSDMKDWLQDTLRSAAYKILILKTDNPDYKKFWAEKESGTMLDWRNL